MNNWNLFPSVSGLFNVCVWLVAVFWLDLSLSLQLVSFQQNRASGKEPTCQCRNYKRHGFDPWVRKIPWKRAWQPTPVFLPGGAWRAPVLRLTVGDDWVTGHSMPQPLSAIVSFQQKISSFWWNCMASESFLPHSSFQHDGGTEVSQCQQFLSRWQTDSSGQLGSVQFSRSIVSDSLRPHGLQHARPPCPSPTPGVHSNLCPLSQWCHPTISSSVIPFSCPQSLPASGSFPMS